MRRGFQRRERGVVQPRARHRARRVVLHQYVGALDETQEVAAPGGVEHVEADAALAPVHAHEVGGVLRADGGAETPREVSARWALDFHHVGAKVGQQHRAEGAGQDPAQVEHLNAVERAGHKREKRRGGR